LNCIPAWPELISLARSRKLGRGRFLTKWHRLTALHVRQRCPSPAGF
jgi:hypothetical protein